MIEVQACVLDVLREIGAVAPGRVAVRDRTRQLSYRDLVDLVEALARGIVAASLPPGPVGVLVEDNAFHVVAMFAVIASGRAVLLLNVDSPAAARNAVCVQAGLAAVLVADGAALGCDLIADRRVRVLAMDALLERPAPELPLVPLPIDAPAMLLTTSGSTGVPKITAHSEAGLIGRIGGAGRCSGTDEYDVALVMGPPWTFGALRNRLAVLLAGGTLAIADLPRTGLAALLDCLAGNRCTMLRATPSLMMTLVRAPGAAAAMASLRELRLGGEALLQTELRAIRACLPAGCRIRYSMAATETSIARWIIPETDPHDPVRVAAGRVLPGVVVRVVDEDGRDVPPGESGELLVRTGLSALGDWVDGTVVRTRFSTDADGFYRTGDIVRLFADGVLVALGRKDRMVKIRGQRVEPGAVEAVLKSVPWVVDAAVVPEGEASAVCLHGFVVAGPDAPAAAMPALRAVLRAELPSYCWPQRLHLLDTLPLHASGKRDDRALVARAAELANGQAPTLLPAADDADLAAVGAVWRRVLPRAPQGGGQRFDDAGGDSLRFVEMMLHLERQVGMALPMDRFTLDMTLAEMAQAMGRIIRPAAQDSGTVGEIVFVLPGAGGDEPGLAWLRGACSPALECVALHYGDWSGFVAPDFSFSAMVARLIGEILDRAPAGRIGLIGYSLGGQLAWVIASRLEAMGRTVSAVVIIDSPALGGALTHGGAHAASQRLTWQGELAQVMAARRAGMAGFALARVVARRLLSPRGGQLLRLLARHHRRILPPMADVYLSNDLSMSLLARHIGRWRSRLGDLAVVQAKVVLLRAMEAPEVAWDLGWQPRCARLEAHPVAGNHLTLLAAPRTAALAALVRAAFAD